MTFHSIAFLVFLIVCFSAFWIINYFKPKYQNMLLLIGSCIFYGWWDWRFLALLFFSGSVDFLLSQKIFHSVSHKKFYLYLTLISNLGLLGLFKYFNFFIDTFENFMNIMGVQYIANSLNIILPIGISFYTFQTLSYSIDVYTGKIKPTRNFIGYMAFVSFFPQLVAGPIERAIHFLPQFFEKKQFNPTLAFVGLRQILWGFIKKVVIADNCAPYVNEVFGHSSEYHGLVLLLAAVIFAFQVYGDFSGYSDIAIGTAKLFGFHLSTNFNYPYFSENISKFWRRWHITLFHWIHNYIYLPLSIKHRYWGQAGIVYALSISFFLSGLWHGANWTFIVFGLLHGSAVIYESTTKRMRKKIRARLPIILSPAAGMIYTFLFWCVTLVFFRSASLQESFYFVFKMVSFSDLPSSFFIRHVDRYVFEIFPLLLGLLIFEWKHKDTLDPIGGKFQSFKIAACLSILLIFGNFVNHFDFIYFQF